jgi:hypothetical protein
MMSAQEGTSSGRLLSSAPNSVKGGGLHSRSTPMDPNWLTAFAALVAAVATFISAVRKK